MVITLACKNEGTNKKAANASADVTTEAEAKAEADASAKEKGKTETKAEAKEQQQHVEQREHELREGRDHQDERSDSVMQSQQALPMRRAM